MYIDLGEMEKSSFNIRLIQLKTIKKIKNVLGKSRKHYLLNYYEDEDEFYSSLVVMQYEIFNNLRHNGVQLQLFAGDISLVRSELINQKKVTEEQVEEIIVEPIIFELYYNKSKDKVMKKKINKVLETLCFNDLYYGEEIGFDPFSVKTTNQVKPGIITNTIYFPCTVFINDEIVNSILNLFL